MEKEMFKLSEADNNAVMLGDADYINNKGAKCYLDENYKDAVEYYRLAAAMGNVQAVSNLGYCYLYGRYIAPNLPLALAYFKTAAFRKNADAAYKLGDIYGNEKWGTVDKEMSLYYYRMAAGFIIGPDWEGDEIAWKAELQHFPSLCYALGRELSPGGSMNTDIRQAYQFLKHAEKGYLSELQNGAEMYRASYEGVMALLANPQFDDTRKQYDRFFEDEEEPDEDTVSF